MDYCSCYDQSNRYVSFISSLLIFIVECFPIIRVKKDPIEKSN
ncbi:hypothetical protein bcf_12170 [Bacillus cereus F837/76]|nr:hypothetical protein bcf_12170 [Bacillus cereus F837/76]